MNNLALAVLFLWVAVTIIVIHLIKLQKGERR